MHNYFSPKIKAVYTFPQGFPFCVGEKKQQHYLGEGKFATEQTHYSVFKIPPVLNKKRAELSRLESDASCYFV